MGFGKGRQHSETDKECKKGRKKIQRELFNQFSLSLREGQHFGREGGEEGGAGEAGRQ